MILNNSQNRKIINQYLNKINEDTFINEFVIPLMSSQGYILLRTNSHSPGEKGKDLIFCKHNEFYNEYEYLAIQAKAIVVTANNVGRISQQLLRAYKNPFPNKSGNGSLKPNYAILINSKKHTNDAYSELPALIDYNQNIKVLAQENVCELIIKTGIAPTNLLKKLSLESKNISLNKYDQQIFDIILNNNPNEIEELFEHKLNYLRNKISDEIKAHIIDYIFELWRQDPTWEGIVKPLMWLSKYFDFIKGEQSILLARVFDEYTSTTPSFKAKTYVRIIISKISIEHIKYFSSEFIDIASYVLFRKQKDLASVIFPLLKELLKNKLIKKKKLIEKSKILILAYDYIERGEKDKFNEQLNRYEKLMWS